MTRNDLTPAERRVYDLLIQERSATWGGEDGLARRIVAAVPEPPVPEPLPPEIEAAIRSAFCRKCKDGWRLSPDRNWHGTPGDWYAACDGVGHDDLRAAIRAYVQRCVEGQVEKDAKVAESLFRVPHVLTSGQRREQETANSIATKIAAAIRARGGNA